MAKKYKKITHRNKKTGEVKYYYYEMSGKTTAGRVSAREFYEERGGNKRKTLTLSEAVDYMRSRSATLSPFYDRRSPGTTSKAQASLPHESHRTLRSLSRASMKTSVCSFTMSPVVW